MLPSLKNERLDPRVKRTRQLLLEAFIELTREKSCSGLTVSEIAERATINRATFYAHFKTYDDFICFVVDETFQETLAARLPADAVFSSANLKRLVLATREFLSGFTSTSSSGEAREISRVESQVQQHVYRILLDWLGRVPVKPNSRRIDPTLKAAALSWALFGVAMDWDRLDLQQPIGEGLDQLLALGSVP